MRTILTGKMSTFGGPHDLGVAQDERLALVNAGNFGKLKEYFLSDPPADPGGLARQLDPQKYYLACRWDYATTPRQHLTQIMVKVTNPSNNKVALAKPLDWGPAAWTGRVADLSPGLADFLGLKTDNICEVEIPHPGDAVLHGLLPGPVKAPGGQPIRVLSESEIIAEFGSFSYNESSTTKGAVNILPPWPQNNLIEITIPQLKGLRNYGSHGFSGKLACHKKVSNALQGAFAAIEQQGLKDLLLFWGGCHVPRHKSWDTSRGLSSHSWGIAVDINPNWNAYNREPASKGEYGSVVELVPIFESFGFAWGGHFKAQDGMHFEYAQQS